MPSFDIARSVVLAGVVVVERDGTVSSATVVDGAAPFDQQARSAVLTWRFEPARRGDTTVRARIRARVAFRREEPALRPAPSVAVPGAAPSSASPPAPGAAPEDPVEVTVQGARREIGETTLSSRELRELPGAFGDPFRAMEILPGVTPAVSGVPYFFVRGAPPTQNGYFVDGIRAPLLFHLGIGSGVLHPALIDRVELYPGAAPAQHGRFAGAIVSAETVEPATIARGQANLRLFDAGALLETPFANGPGTALVAGRYGYPGRSSVRSRTRSSRTGTIRRARRQLLARDRVSVFAFGSHDRLAMGTPAKEQLVASFHRVDVRWDHGLERGNVRFAVTLGTDSQGAYPVYVQDRSGAVRVELERDLSDSVRLRAGGDAHLDTYGFQLREVSQEEPFTPSSASPAPTDVTTGAYADVVWQVSPRVQLVPGARVDVFASSREDGPGGSRTHTVVPAADPRLAARITVSRHVAWLSAIGLSHQYPTLRVGDMPAPIASVPGFRTGSRTVQTVAQLSQGVELTLPHDFTVTATGFLSRWSGLTDLTPSCFELDPPTFVPTGPDGPPPPHPPIVCPDEAPVTARRTASRSSSAERSRGRSAAGSRTRCLASVRETHFATPSGGTAAGTVPSEGDRTHVLNAVLSYDLERRWRFGSRFSVLSGAPYSRFSRSAPIPPYNDQRAPPFLRLDVRLEKRWLLGGDRSIAFVLEGQNVTLSKETTPWAWIAPEK